MKLSTETIAECPECAFPLCEICFFNLSCESCGTALTEERFPEENRKRVAQFRQGLEAPGVVEHPEIGRFLDDDEEDLDEVIRAKRTFDGASTLTEAAAMLRGYADQLEKLGQEGWLLRQKIEGDYGFIYHPDGRRLYSS